MRGCPLKKDYRRIVLKIWPSFQSISGWEKRRGNMDRGKGRRTRYKRWGEGLLVKEAAGNKIGCCPLGKSAPPLHLLAAAASTNPSHLPLGQTYKLTSRLMLTRDITSDLTLETQTLTSHLELDYWPHSSQLNSRLMGLQIRNGLPHIKSYYNIFSSIKWKHSVKKQTWI